jgi:phenylalanyl-tRNA synthetase beta chain
MKFSIAWILDHIAIKKKDVAVPELIKLFNSITAEIDSVEYISTDLAHLYAGRITGMLDREVLVFCPELGTTYCLPVRKDSSLEKGFWYLIKHIDTEVRWASLSDFGSSKEGILASLFMSDLEAHGAWRDPLDKEDAIITIDNKALTNRPDLWGHRGCAREMAAIVRKSLIQEENLLADLMITHYDKISSQLGARGTISLETTICRRFAGLAIPQITYRPSLPWMALRLARIDVRPIDALVDMTNYVMNDIGQPMHAFDSDALMSNHIAIRNARSGEKIRLLDGEEVSLMNTDCVISDGDRAVSLAGVMGGLETSVSSKTKALFLESANFEPTPIRLTASRLKKRTDSSTRYEKNLDPNQNTQGILRYLKLLQDAQIPYQAEDAIISLGNLWQVKVIELSHELIENKIGMKISFDKVIEILKHLEFGVISEHGHYRVTVPTFRGIRDVTIAEDIVEEIARFVGYRNIIPVLPERSAAAFDTSIIERRRRLKNLCAYGLAMHEVQTYAFYDEAFLRKLSFDPLDAPRIANPLSDHWQRLVTSLVPNLIACVVTNQGQDTLRFFEINRVWYLQDKPVELQECAGIWYEKKRTIDFYEGKALVDQIMFAFGITLRWVKPQANLAPWYDKHQSAELWHQDRIVGRAGKSFSSFLGQVLEGEAFFFELDANFLMHTKTEHTHFVPLAKYPSTEQDISILAPSAISVQEFENAIYQADERIRTVCLIDSFEKPEWSNKKSLTFRYTAVDHDATLTKEHIELIAQHVSAALRDLGGEIR